MNKDEKKAAEMRLLYQSSLDNIDYMKRRQWYVAYYAILLYAALFSLAMNEVVKDENLIPRDILFGATWVVALASVYLIHKLQNGLVLHRTHLHEIQDKEFEEETQNIRAIGSMEGREKHIAYAYDKEVLGLLFGATLIGAVLVSKVICPDANCI